MPSKTEERRFVAWGVEPQRRGDLLHRMMVRIADREIGEALAKARADVEGLRRAEQAAGQAIVQAGATGVPRGEAERLQADYKTKWRARLSAELDLDEVEEQAARLAKLAS